MGVSVYETRPERRDSAIALGVDSIVLLVVAGVSGQGIHDPIPAVLGAGAGMFGVGVFEGMRVLKAERGDRPERIRRSRVAPFALAFGVLAAAALLTLWKSEIVAWMALYALLSAAVAGCIAWQVGALERRTGCVLVEQRARFKGARYSLVAPP